MLIWLLYLCVTVASTATDVAETWYKGCFEANKNDTGVSQSLFQVDSSVHCAKSCFEKGFNYSGSQQAAADISCWCLDGLDLLQNTTEDSCQGGSSLPQGRASGSWGVYRSAGPYLTQVTVEVDNKWTVVNVPVHIEIVAEVASPVNVSSDPALSSIGRLLTIDWLISKDGTNGSVQLRLNDSETFHRIQHKFATVGRYKIEVTVSNGISSLSSNLHLDVIYPEPKDLQVGMLSGLDPPSCIPDEFNISHLHEDEKSVLAVFVNTSVSLEASVALGTNLTFTFIFEDSGEDVTHTCEQCTSVIQVHKFSEIAVSKVTVWVANDYGQLRKNLTLIVVPKVLSDLELKLHPDSLPITTVNDSLNFIVSVFTTSRLYTFLELNYGDNNSDIIPIKDTNTSGLILHGNNKDVDIIASYGEGCRLVVEFQYIYAEEGSYNPSVTISKTSFNSQFEKNRTASHTEPSEWLVEGKKLHANLEQEILVLKEIAGVRFESERIAKCYENTRFTLQFVPKLNVSVIWTVNILNDEDGDVLVEKILLNSIHLTYKFNIAGAYLVTSEVSNALSATLVSTNIVVQCPLVGLTVTCLEEFIPTGEVLECTAVVESGTDIAFLWLLEGPDEFESKHVFYENYTSVLRIRLTAAGQYDIRVHAGNNISSSYVDIEPPITVQDPIDHIIVYKMSRTLLGNLTDFIVVYQPTNSHVNYYCKFDIDFGDGRKHIPNTVCKDWNCYVGTSYRFPRPGKHKVLVYGYNEVSEVEEEVEVWIVPGLDNVSVEVLETPVAGYPVRFVVKENGVVMETENVYFNWKFSVEEKEYCTNSPVVEKVFHEPGDFMVALNATNPVVFKTFEIPLKVKPSRDVKILLLHDLYVAPDDDLHFTLKGPLIGWSKLLVSYSDGTSQRFDEITYEWSHSFHETGSYQVNVTLLGAEETTIEVITSYMVVEKPITDLVLKGPVAVAFEKNKTSLWYAEMFSGTHVVYRWFLEEKIITTIPEFEVAVSKPGLCTVQLEAWNDITPPTKAALRVIVEIPIKAVQLQIIGGLVGQETLFLVDVYGYLPFRITVDFGDGTRQKINIFDSFANLTTVESDYLHYLSFTHVYENLGEFLIVVNVFNNVSNVTTSEVFVPIASVSLTTGSPWVMKTPGHVVVTGVVEGGQDLQYFWDFSDSFEETLWKRYENKTSVAIHPYGMSGEYRVMLNVTSDHYPPPGVAARLPRNFSVIDPIDRLKLTPSEKSAAITNGRTKEIIFEAVRWLEAPRLACSFAGCVVQCLVDMNVTSAILTWSTGSHVKFLFDYGDGTTEEITGLQLPEMYVDMTMYGKGRHIYTEEGVYKLKVTAVNPLSNMTYEMSRPFYVQEPPKKIIIHQYDYNRNGYAVKVGERIEFKASVVSGTNVTLDWKMGDQTDIVKAGPVVSHTYQTPGVKTVHVTAKNEVVKLEENITVFVNYEIQHVEIIPERTTMAVNESVLYRAVVTPAYRGIVSLYVWKFRCPFQGRGRSRNGELIETRSNKILFTFEETGGWCTASVQASNAISSASSAAVDIHVVEKIINLEIVVKSYKLVSQPIIFEYYAYSGGALNVTWSFGDGSSDIVTNEREVNHTYNRQGMYVVTLTARNPVSTSTVHKRLFVLDEPYCNEPEVTILTEAGFQIFKSHSLILEADVTTDCNVTTLLTYDWLVKSHGHIIRTDTRKKMVFSPGLLGYGNYSVNLKVVMQGTIVFSYASVMIQVIPSALVSSIKGGVYRHMNRQDDIVLDGSGSYDPDDPADVRNNLRFNWTCWFMSENGKFGDICFQDNLIDRHPSVAMNTSVLSFPGYRLIEADNFTFTLSVSAPNKTSHSSFQVIHMLQTDSMMADVKINCLRCSSGPVNANEKVSFSVVCDSCTRGRTRYEWSLYVLKDTRPSNPARAHDTSCVEPDGSSYQPYILAEKELAKEEAILTTGKRGNNTGLSQDSDFMEKDDSDVRFVTDDNAVEYNIVTTIKPALPWDIEISEGDPSDGFNRKRREILQLKRSNRESNGTAPFFEIPLVQHEGDPGERGRNSYSISENRDHSSSRGLPKYDNDIISNFPFGIDIKEGDPGVSGSAGSRQYGVPDSSRTLPTADSDHGSGRVIDFDKLEGPQTAVRPQMTILDNPRFPVFLAESDTKMGLSGPALVIKPGVLKQGWTYLAELKLWNTETGQKGEAKSIFTVNISPVNGKCTVSPESGVALETDFRVHCTEWRKFQNHQPIMYEVSYRTRETGQKNLIYRGLDYSFTFKLPAGDPSKNHTVQLFIDILDGLLAKTVVCSIDVKVRPHYQIEGNSTAQILNATTIYDEIGNFSDTLQDAVDTGNDAMVRVYIGYLAARLNELASYSAEDLERKFNSSSEDVILLKNFLKEKRKGLLEVLKDLPIRDEGEVLQSAQALSYTTACAEELSLMSLDIALNVLMSLSARTQDIYNGRPSEIEEFIPLVVRSASSIIRSASRFGRNADRKFEYFYRRIITDSVKTVEDMVLKELQNHVITETPIQTSADDFSVLSSRQSTDFSEPVQIERSKFVLPPNLDEIVKTGVGIHNHETANDKCYQSHMTTFRRNPYSFGKTAKIQSSVSSLSLFDCDGRPVQVENLRQDQLIQVELPNHLPLVEIVPVHTLKKWGMNLHQFNITKDNFHHARHLVVEFTPVDKGRLFPVSVLLSHRNPPTPERYLYKYDIDRQENILKVFMPAGSLNMSGEYYIGIVDKTYNSGRLRPGEITERNYTIDLWFGECLYWHQEKEAWLADGCWVSQDSTVEVTKCRCNHLTAFGVHFELIPNKLIVVDVENFFLPHRNPVTFSLISVILVLYCGLLVLCRHADRHDAKKGGIVYLLDNTPMDQQKYELTIETGFRKGAGTSAKISIILHGEEGMSETRELISDDNRPLFERNSRDKFILTLPDSIGKIWKVQVWHNNFGESPSWYLSRVIVRDLNTGNSYYFICEKWLAVEEQDGKVEREFMALEGPLEFSKIFWSKGIEYMADFHLWTSLITRPSYSGFMLTERLTCCLTAFMMYMCLNAMWYKTAETEYRGEFGLLDLSCRSITVGVICCGTVLPVMLLLQFLFRRSKPASSCHTQDEIAEWERDYPSGKPNEQEVSEDSTEHVPPVMTYSLLDQSILNWPNIQHWAQKQWMKRQQSGRSSAEEGTDTVTGNQAAAKVILRPPASIADSPFSRRGLSELDQASSGFEDCSSLIRPKASVDSTRTTAAPSLTESTKAHRPQSIPDSLQTLKPPSGKTSKAPSISSAGSNKSSVLAGRKEEITNRIYLPFWCRYVAWALCGVICVACAVVTIMYGFRFGITKSTLWLQSLYFSMIICVFILNPFLILVAVIYSAVRYRNDPRVFDHYDIFNRGKAKQDLNRWKKQIEITEEGDALERGVAARQRSRYLRFARPPQEKQLIEARKKIMKEKKARAVLRETVAFIATILLLLIMAYGKDTSHFYHLNTAVRNDFLKTGSPNFTSVKTREQWFDWTKGPFLRSLHSHYILGDLDNDTFVPAASSHVIGKVHLRQQRVQLESCNVKLPYITATCIDTQGVMATEAFGGNNQWHHSDGHLGYFIFTWSSMYDKSGFVVELENNRSVAKEQLQELQMYRWLDRQSRNVFLEFTLYNPPTNLFTSVKFLLDLSPIGGVSTSTSVKSTHLFRYVTGWDNFVLACELMFFVVMMYRVKLHAIHLIKRRQKYFINLWNILEFTSCLISVVFCACYIYRFFLVSDTVERLRSTYYEEFVDISFVAAWDEVLRSAVAILLFLAFVKSLRLLRYNKQFAMFGLVYRKARREVLLFLGLFVILLCAYTSLGRALFGATSKSFRDLWISLLTVSALLVRDGTIQAYSYPLRMYGLRTFLFTFAIFVTGFLTAYMVAVLSRYFRSRKKRRLLAMSMREAILFYWDQFQLWTGWKKPLLLEEPEVVLPPEFTMAEIEYQVEELLFRMNALTGTHSLPEKPPCYLTDSDCTYGGGDDGISSGGSEGQQIGEDRLEQRVQKIEDNLCSQEPFLAQLLKLDSIGDDDLSQEKEKQLRSHLELEIFRQLQIQRQEVFTPPGGEHEAREGNSNNTDAVGQKACDLEVPSSPGHDSNPSSSSSGVQQQTTSSGNTSTQSSPSEEKFQKVKKPRSGLVLQTLHDLISKTVHDSKDSHDNSSSNPDSPRDKISFSRSKKGEKTGDKSKLENSSSMKHDKTQMDTKSEVLKGGTEFNDGIKKLKKPELPAKPTFLQSREPYISEGARGSPIMKLRTSGPTSRSDSGSCTDRITTESSSGSEQDGFHYGRKPVGKRSLRKTKSRGKGKGPDDLEPSLVLDEEGEAIEEVSEGKCEGKGEVMDTDGAEYVVTAEVHMN